MSPEAQKNKAMARDSQKAGEKPKVPPERECWHRTIFSIVCYACLVALLITGIPRLKTMFTPRGQSVCASPLLEKMSQLLDTAVVVRQDGHAPSASSTSVVVRI